MNKDIAKASTCAAVLLASVGVAQAQPANQSVGQERSSFVQQFRDPGNSEAKAVAAREGISVGEATKRLRLERQAANALFKLYRKGLADDIVFEVDRGKLVVYSAQSTPAIGEVIDSSIDADLRGSVAKKSLRRSPRDLKSAVATLVPVLQEAPGFEGFRVRQKDGLVNILSTDAASTQAYLTVEGINLPEFVSVKASEAIVLTANVRGGRAAAYSTSSCNGGTWGWVVYETANTTRRGILTAAHVVRENTSSSLKYPTRTSLTDCRSGTTQSLVKEWRGFNDAEAGPTVRHGVDMAYLRNSNDMYERLYWDGALDRYVHGSYLPPVGVRLCRYGRITGQACGTLQDDLIWSNGYGYMSWIVLDAGKTTMKGDSGGPVWYGSTYTYATGLTHAVWGENSRNMLYSEVANLSDRGTGLEVLYFD